VIARMFVYRPRNMSSVQSEMHRPASPEEAEVEAALGPTSGDGGEVSEEAQTEETELELEADEEQVGADSSQPQLSRSQKRRRHRR
jgi:hypothetical protein